MCAFKRPLNKMKENASALVAGVDIGGTHVRLGVLRSSTSRVVHLSKFKTSGLSLDQFCDALDDGIGAYRPEIIGIGIAVNGFCNGDLRRVLTTCGVVPFLESCHLAAAVEKRLCKPVRVDNDARAHAIGEFQYGGWGKPRSLVVMTLGTGVGLAWQIDGQIFPPPNHGAQGGHMVISWPGGNPCFCGATGCLESLVSGTSLAAAANERLARYVPSQLKFPVSSEQVCSSGHSDALARGCITRAVESLRCALHTLHHLYFPDVVVLGGGLAPGLWPYLGELRKWFSQAERYDGRRNRLVLSRLGDKAGVLGAAALIKSQVS